jgi:hypothetical protein
MNTRRFFLRLAVAVITFLVGWTAATLFGATQTASYVAPPTPRAVIVREYEWSPRRVEHPPCGSYEMRHAFEWREDRAGVFEAPLPPPPPPPSR